MFLFNLLNLLYSIKNPNISNKKVDILTKIEIEMYHYFMVEPVKMLAGKAKVILLSPL